MTNFPFKTKPGVGAKPLTEEQAKLLFTPEQIEAGEIRGKLKTYGMWQIPVSYKALAVSQNFAAKNDILTVYGVRTLSRTRSCGHELEGKVSVNGKKYRGFTSSVLFELPSGRLRRYSRLRY